MTINRRELILARLQERMMSVPGVAEVDGVKSVFRNRGAVPDELRPAIVVLDGREVLVTTISQQHREMPPAIMRVLPQIWVLVRARDNVNNDTLDNQSAPIGEELSAWQVKVQGAIYGDEVLLGLLGDSGGIDWQGLDTDLEAAAEMTGELLLNFGFRYYFNPAEVIG